MVFGDRIDIWRVDDGERAEYRMGVLDQFEWARGRDDGFDETGVSTIDPRDGTPGRGSKHADLGN